MPPEAMEAEKQAEATVPQVPPAKSAVDGNNNNNNNNVKVVAVADSTDGDDDEVFLRRGAGGVVAVPSRASTAAAAAAAGSTDDEYEYLAVACADCGDLFPTLNELLLHRVEAHPDRRPRQCPACMAAFHRADQLDLHRRTHTRHTPHACPHCGRRFTLRKHVSAHARALHAKELAKEAAAGAGQQQPPLQDGAERQEFRCRICSNRVFHTSSGLSNHMRSHSDERPFACEVCRERFRYRSSMVRHVKKKHTPAV